jgi:hypothetical protein
LIKAVKRNLDRFPPDFMFQLTSEETENLRFQIGISSSDFGGRRYLPYAFTERGAFDAIRQLMAPPPPEPPKPEIGFHVKEDAVSYRTKRKPSSQFILELSQLSGLRFQVSALCHISVFQFSAFQLFPAVFSPEELETTIRRLD